MRNKIIFASIVVALFALSGLAGYYGPDWLRERGVAQEREAFVPAGVPKSAERALAARFRTLDKATEPKRLSDLPFVDLAGKTVRMSDFQGVPTLVNFWATWCGPCVVELPWLEKLGKHYDGRMNVVAISLDQGKKTADIATFLERRELGDFAGYLDESGDLTKDLKLRGIPTTYLLGSDGLILYRFEGDANWTLPEFVDFFDIFLLQNR